MINRYALSDYTIKISFPTGSSAGGGLVANYAGKVITLGGPGENGLTGSFLGEAVVERSEDTWSTQGDATGSWVHSKSLNRTGTVTVNLRLVSDDTIKLNMLCNIYEQDDYNTKGLSIQIYKNSTLVVDCIDCYCQRLPRMPLQDEAQNLEYTFTCGLINFKETTSWGSESVGV